MNKPSIIEGTKSHRLALKESALKHNLFKNIAPNQSSPKDTIKKAVPHVHGFKDKVIKKSPIKKDVSYPTRGEESKIAQKRKDRRSKVLKIKREVFGPKMPILSPDRTPIRKKKSPYKKHVPGHEKIKTNEDYLKEGFSQVEAEQMTKNQGVTGKTKKTKAKKAPSMELMANTDAARALQPTSAPGPKWQEENRKRKTDAMVHGNLINIISNKNNKAPTKKKRKIKTTGDKDVYKRVYDKKGRVIKGKKFSPGSKVKVKTRKKGSLEDFLRGTTTREVVKTKRKTKGSVTVTKRGETKKKRSPVKGVKDFLKASKETVRDFAAEKVITAGGKKKAARKVLGKALGRVSGPVTVLTTAHKLAQRKESAPKTYMKRKTGYMKSGKENL